MKSLMRIFSVLFFSAGLFLTAKAQDTSMNAPAEDAIVCTQIAENVFDCYVQPGGEFEEQHGTEDNKDLREEDLKRNEDMESAPDDSSGPSVKPEENDYETEPNPADPYYQEINTPITI